ncbi:MAG: transferase hexapeptide repeat containing protein [Waterburya sp.]
MLDETVLERRLLTLEQAVVDLQRKVEDKPSQDWLKKLIGSVSDEEAFLDALEYGRALRQADRPTG